MKYNIKHKNITINVDDSNQYSSQMGYQDETTWFIKPSTFTYMYKKTWGTSIGEDIEEGIERFKDLILTECFEDLITEYYDLEDPRFNIGVFIDSKLKNVYYNKEDLVINCADAMIILLHNIITYKGGTSKKYEFEVEGNLFWICHDLMHAEKDVMGTTIYTDDDIEEQRIIDGWEYSLLQGADEPLSLEEFEELKEAFFFRFKRPLVCRDIEIYFEEQYMDEIDRYK